MPAKHVTLKNPRLKSNKSDVGFAIGPEEDAWSARKDYLINPRILILTGVGIVFFLFTMVYDPSPAKLTPFFTEIKDERVMEREIASLRSKHHLDDAELDRIIKAVEKQMQSVSQAEAVGDKSRAKLEMAKLMFINGGYADSPLYKFCVSRLKEY